MRTKTFTRLASTALLLIAATGISLIGGIRVSSAQALICPPGGDCPCTWTTWLDRDNPSGVGDFETLADFQKDGKLKCKRPLAVQCRYKPDKTGTGSHLWGYQAGTYTILAGPAGYSCVTTQGGICTNAGTNPKNSCQDSEVRFCCLPE